MHAAKTVRRREARVAEIEGVEARAFAKAVRRLIP